MIDKAGLRKSILPVRDSILKDDRERFDSMIADRVVSVFGDLGDDTVLTYVSFRSEVSTHGLIERFLKMGVKVAVPRVEGEDIRFYHISSFDDLKEGYMGILEPADTCRPWKSKFEDSSLPVPEGAIDTVILVPGSVFDRHGKRIGYGGGFYDRFLTAHPELYSCGLAYECQITDSVPADQLDRSVDMVITQEHMYQA